MIIVAFYTKNTTYEGLAMKLQDKLNELQYENYIVGYDSRGTWQKNTRIKAEFLCSVCEKFKDNDILYLDVDCEIVRNFDIYKDIDAKTDIAMIQERFYYNPTFNEMVNCTIFFRANDKIYNLFTKWSENCLKSQNTQVLEQYELQQLIEQDKNIRFQRLPIEYGFIFDTCRKMYPYAQPYIIENQASRIERGKKI